MSQLSIQQATQVVAEAIAEVAPDIESELGDVDPDRDVFEALDLDSMDHVNVMTRLWERTGVEIAERDYGRLRTLNALAEHISAAEFPLKSRN